VVEHVGIAGVAGIEVLLGGETSPDLEAALADGDAEPRLGEIGAGDQAVGSPADDDDIELALLGELFLHVSERVVRIVLEIGLVFEVRHGVRSHLLRQRSFADFLPCCGM
jgi:hypothetical protein